MSRRKVLDGLQLKALSPNAGLWMNKFSRCLDRQKADDFNRIFAEVAELRTPPLYRKAFERWESALRSAGALVAKATGLGRLIVGLGNESTLETSITLQHTYGVPILPGSALKGVAASFAARELDGWQLQSEAHRQLFGCSDPTGAQQAGCVVFHDAWPDPGNRQPFYHDVINVHHKDYYQTEAEALESPPADWDDPVPIAFLTSAGDYWVAVSGGSAEWSQAALEILGMALEEYGVGAKTTRGYGRFKLEAPKAQVRPAARSGALDEYLKELAAATPKDKNTFTSVHVERWRKLTDSEQRRQFGRAILERLDQLGWTKGWKEKSWYQEILASLAD